MIMKSPPFMVVINTPPSQGRAHVFNCLTRARRTEHSQKKPEQPLPSSASEAGDPAQAPVPSDLPVLVPLSIAKLRRLCFHLVGNPSLTFAYYLAWSCWRRAHQALARLCHYQRRCTLAGHLQL